MDEQKTYKFIKIFTFNIIPKNAPVVKYRQPFFILIFIGIKAIFFLILWLGFILYQSLFFLIFF